MPVELIENWYNEYYAAVLKREPEKPSGLVGAIRPTAQQMEDVKERSGKLAQRNLALSMRVLELAFPNLKPAWRELLSIIISAVDRDYHLKASKEELANATGLGVNEFHEAFAMLELKKYIQVVVYEPGRERNLGRVYVPLAHGLQTFPYCPYD